MNLGKIILILLCTLITSFVNGQNNTIIHSVSFDYIEACENRVGECGPVNLYRKSIEDTIIVYFPNGGTQTDVFLSRDSLDEESGVRFELKKHETKYMGEGRPKFEMTGYPDGKYAAQIFACAIGGRIELNIKTLSSECIPPIDTIDNKSVFIIAEKMPEFKGGEEQLARYLMNNIKYAEIESTNDLQNRIQTTFVIDTTGKVRNPCIVKPKYSGTLTQLETEVLNVIENMPKWEPAIDNGRKVAVRYYLPVNISYR